jgi:hypothetical protein
MRLIPIINQKRRINQPPDGLLKDLGILPLSGQGGTPL